jgi:hypothetical protein
MSFGSGEYRQACAPSPYEAALGAAREAGMISVAGAGNGGYLDALPAPACAPSAVSVGAVYDASYGSFSAASVRTLEDLGACPLDLYSRGDGRVV